LPYDPWIYGLHKKSKWIETNDTPNTAQNLKKTSGLFDSFEILFVSITEV
jgi:hypothetical protein